LLAHRAQHRIDAIDDRARTHDLAMRQRRGRVSRQFIEHPEVGMPRGLRNHGPGGIEARSRHEAGVDSPLEAPDRSLHVAHGGESALQHVGTDLGGGKIDVTDIRRQQIDER
jgi:hypothetical protein